MKKEWMPVNPCKGCPDCEGAYYKPTCLRFRVYDESINAQNKLLEYLIADAKNINDHNLYPIIGKVQLESMLKQLENK